MNSETTVLSTFLGKTFFVWRFILNENILFWFSISYQKPFVFSVSVFCSQIFTVKLNLWQEIGLTYAISIVKWFLGFLSKKIFFIFLRWILIIDVSKQHFENFRKNEQAELVENLPQIYLPYRILHNLHSFLLWGKSENIWFFKNHWLE